MCDSGPLDGSSFRELLDALRGIGGAHCAAHLRAAVNATSLPTQPLLAADGVSQNPFSQLLKLPPQQDLASWQRSVRVAQELSWEAVHTGPWRDVHVAWRDSYSVCGLLMAAQQVIWIPRSNLKELTLHFSSLFLHCSFGYRNLILKKKHGGCTGVRKRAICSHANSGHGRSHGRAPFPPPTRYHHPQPHPPAAWQRPRSRH